MSEAHSPARPVIPTEQKDLVTLREFEQRMSELRQLYDERTRYEREILSTRENLMEKALQKQASEYERRLTELNHAHATAMENWRTSMPRELFDQWEREYQKWKEGIQFTQTKLVTVEALDRMDTRLKEIERGANKVAGALVLLGFAGAAGIIGLLLGILRLAGVLQ